MPEHRGAGSGGARGRELALRAEGQSRARAVPKAAMGLPWRPGPSGRSDWDVHPAGVFVSTFWDVPGDVLAAPESALCGWIGVLSSLPLPIIASLASALTAKLTREAKRGFDEGFRVPASWIIEWIIPLQIWGLVVWLLVCELKSALMEGTLCYFGPASAMTCVVPQPTCRAV